MLLMVQSFINSKMTVIDCPVFNDYENNDTLMIHQHLTRILITKTSMCTPMSCLTVPSLELNTKGIMEDFDFPFNNDGCIETHHSEDPFHEVHSCKSHYNS